MADLQKFLDQSGVSVLWNQVVTKINDQVAANKYDDTQVKADIAANTTAISDEVTRAKAAEAANAKAITDLEASVASDIADAVAGIVGGADGAYDTLKEIADWIATHPESVSALNTSIKANADAIDALKALVGDVAVATQITEALKSYVTAASLNTTLADYVKSADVAAVHAQVETNKAGVASNLASINNLVSRLDGIVAQGGEPNVINNIKVNGVVQTIAEDKSVDIAVPVIAALTEAEIKSAIGVQ